VVEGEVFEKNMMNYTLTVYGHAIAVKDSEIFPEKYDEGDNLPESVSYVVPDGAGWDIEGVTSDMTALPTVANVKMTVKSGGTLNLVKNTHLKFKGSLIVEEGGILYVDETSSLEIVSGTAIINGNGSVAANRSARAAALDPNNGVLNNSGKLSILAGSTLTNAGIINNKSTGTITNKGTIDNEATGKITNTGTIDNTDGEIDNEGTIESDIPITGNDPKGNDVVPIGSNGGDNDDDNSGDSGSSSGGCNTGLGLFGLLFAGLVTRTYRKA
jgi:hypothetical protein